MCTKRDTRCTQFEGERQRVGEERYVANASERDVHNCNDGDSRRRMAEGVATSNSGAVSPCAAAVGGGGGWGAGRRCN